AATGKLSAAWDGQVDEIEFGVIAERGTRLLVCGRGKAPYLHDWSKGEKIRRLLEGKDRDNPGLLGVALSPDGCLAALQAKRGEVALWDLEKWPVVRRLQGQHNTVYALVFSPDQRTLATLGLDGELRLWSLEDGTSTGRVTGHLDRSWSVAYSPDGRRL